MDVCKYYVSGLMTRPSDLAHLYDPVAQATIFGKLLHCRTTFVGPTIPDKAAIFVPNEYTPQFCLLMFPARLLSLRQFILLCESLFLTLGVFSITIILKRYSCLSGGEIVCWWLITLCSHNLYNNIFIGQILFFVTSLMALFYGALLAKKNWAMAIILNLIAIIKPHYALLPLIMTLCTRRYKSLVFACAIGLSALALTGFMLGFGTLVDYPRHLADIMEDSAKGRYSFEPAGMANLIGPFIMLFGPKLGNELGFVVMIVGLVLLWKIWQRAYAVGEQIYPFAFAASLPLVLLTSPHALYHDIALLNVGWAVTIPTLLPAKIKLLDNGCHRYWCYLFLIYPVIAELAVFFNLNRGPYNQVSTIIIAISAYLLFRSKIGRTDLSQ